MYKRAEPESLYFLSFCFQNRHKIMVHVEVSQDEPSCRQQTHSAFVRSQSGASSAVTHCPNCCHAQKHICKGSPINTILLLPATPTHTPRTSLCVPLLILQCSEGIELNLPSHCMNEVYDRVCPEPLRGRPEVCYFSLLFSKLYCSRSISKKKQTHLMTSIFAHRLARPHNSLLRQTPPFSIRLQSIDSQSRIPASPRSSRTRQVEKLVSESKPQPLPVTKTRT